MIRYRIAVLNDYNDSFAFLDYRNYGSLEVFDASVSRGQHRGYQLRTDSICVFLNYEKVGEYVAKDPAIALVKKLVDEAPHKDFEEYLDLLLQTIN